MVNDVYIAGMDGNPDHMVSTRDRHVISRPAGPGGGATIFGMNVGDGNPRSDLATRLLDFGRVPMCRAPYYSTLPGTFDTSLATLRSPEKRAVISFDVPCGTITSGSYDSAITTWAQSVPSDWWVGLCYKSEPNQHIINGEYTITEYQNAVFHISALLNTLTSAARVVPCNIISAPKSYQTGNWVDSWMFNFSSMGNSRAIFCWDNYGNPFGGGTDGTSLYGPKGAYPPVEAVTDRGYNLLNSHGWCATDGHWAYTEFNAPMRVRGPNPPASPYGPTGDEDETIRTQWITDYCNYALSRPAKPHHILLWEGDGTQFDQQFYHANVRNAFKPFCVASA